MAAEHAYQLNRSNAPAYNPSPSRRTQRPVRPTVVPQPQRPRHTLEERKAQERSANVKIARIFMAAVLAIVLLGGFCFTNALRNSSRRTLDKVNQELSDYTNANIVLSTNLQKMVGPDKIDKIATERLGLVKVATNNDSFLVLNEENQVVQSKNKN